CHKSTVTFAGAQMNHTGITGNCASCHNGVIALGKPTSHIPTTAPCETCHRSTVTFAGARLDHSRVSAPCASCHNGATAEGKPTRHFVTNLPCELCHRTVTWTPVTYRHTSPAFVDHGPALACNSCHVSNAQVVPWKFPNETGLRGLSCGQVSPAGACEVRASSPGLLHRHGTEGLCGGLSHLHGQHATNDPDAADRYAPGHRRRLVMKRTACRQTLALIAATAVMLAVRGASAEPVVDQALADAQMVVQKGCAILKVNFNIRIRYASHFPLERGDELRIT